MPGPWLRGPSKVLIWIGSVFAGMQAFQIILPLVRGTGSPGLLGIGILLVLLATVIVVHELGHYLVARGQGMQVLFVRIGPVELYLQRGRLRTRWVPKAGFFSGGVTAYCSLEKSFRRQQWRFILGGSLCNLAVAVASAGVAWQAWDAPWARVLLVFALLNALIGLVNWLPLSNESDGAQLCRLWKGLDLGQPGMEVYEYNQRAMAGMTADEQPGSILEGLDRESPSIALWFRVFAALNRRDLAAMRDAEARLEAWEGQLEHSVREALAIFRNALRTEIRFVRAIEDGVPPPSPDAQWLEHAAYARPGTPERYEALRHALAGRTEARDAALARAERESEFNPDAAARKTEARLRDWIRSLATEPEVKVTA